MPVAYITYRCPANDASKLTSFSKQAFSNIHKKYAGTVIGAAESEAPTTPAKAKRTTTKKRPAVDGGESINGDVKSSKKGGASGGRQNKKIKADEGDSDADGDATSNNDDGDALKTE